MSIYFSPPYAYQPLRFRVPELHYDSPGEAYHVESVEGVEVVMARDYDELRRNYDDIYAALMRQLRGQ